MGPLFIIFFGNVPKKENKHSDIFFEKEKSEIKT